MVVRLSSFALLTILVVLCLSSYESTHSGSLLSYASADESALEIDDTAAPDGKCDAKNKNCKKNSEEDDTVDTGAEINMEESDDDDSTEVTDDDDEPADDDDDEEEEEEEEKKDPDSPHPLNPADADDTKYIVPPVKAADAYFFESFQDEELEQWVHTEDSTYDGSFKVGQGKEPSLAGDRGLIIPQKARKYGISAKIEGLKKIADKKVVIQYEVKFEGEQTCGGAYVKLPLPGFDQKKFDGSTPYSIMFGPDKCGGTNKIHFIFQSEHKKNKKEHHFDLPPSVPNPGQIPETHLYTLVIDNVESAFNILIDGESQANGTFDKSFKPAVQEPEKIDDPSDKKPKDWVDAKKIPDENAEKPDDWDEDAPKEIEDEKATIPDDWEVDTPLKIPDPNANKPDDWDEEEDGTWEAPSIDNPHCAEISGCGPWKKPKIPNPDYKGKWQAPMIDNPKYVGPWKAKQIPNPDYYKVDKITTLPIGGVALELWTMDQGVVFDNIYIGKSEEKAKEFADATWGEKVKVEKERTEKKKEELEKQKQEHIKRAATEPDDTEEDDEDEDDDDDDMPDDDEEGDEAGDADDVASDDGEEAEPKEKDEL